MVAGLLPGLDLPQLHAGISGGVVEHGHELFLCGEVGAGAGSHISAPGQQTHGPVVDLLVPGDGIADGLAGLGEGGRVQNDEIVPGRLLLQSGQQVKDIGRHALHHAFQTVACRIGPGHLHGGLRYVYCGDVGRTAQRGVQGKGSGVGKAVQHRLAPGQSGHRPAVVLLVQEEAGLLAVFHVYQVLHAVFRDLRDGRVRGLLAGKMVPSLPLGQTLLFPQGHVIAQKHAPDGLPVLPQDADQQGQQKVLNVFHAHREDLHAQKVVELVHGQARESVRLAEDDPAGVQIRRVHDGLAVVPGPAELPLPKGLVEAVVGVSGEQTDPDLGVFGEKAGAQIPAFFAHHVHQAAVIGGTFRADDLRVIDPGVTPENGGLRLGSHGVAGITAGCFHR